MYFEGSFGKAIFGHFDHFGRSKWLEMTNSKNDEHCSPFSFQIIRNSAVYFYFIHFYFKCIVNKHLFYQFYPFEIVKTILNCQNYFNQIIILPISSI